MNDMITNDCYRDSIEGTLVFRFHFILSSVRLTGEIEQFPGGVRSSQHAVEKIPLFLVTERDN
jgi:hypothetical protein